MILEFIYAGGLSGLTVWAVWFLNQPYETERPDHPNRIPRVDYRDWIGGKRIKPATYFVPVTSRTPPEQGGFAHGMHYRKVYKNGNLYRYYSDGTIVLVSRT